MLTDAGEPIPLPFCRSFVCSLVVSCVYLCLIKKMSVIFSLDALEKITKQQKFAPFFFFVSFYLFKLTSIYSHKIELFVLQDHSVDTCICFAYIYFLFVCLLFV